MMSIRGDLWRLWLISAWVGLAAFACLYTGSVDCGSAPTFSPDGGAQFGVWSDVRDPVILRAFGAALDYWSEVSELDWRVDAGACSLSLESGPLGSGSVGRGLGVTDAQFQSTGWNSSPFVGKVVFNSEVEHFPNQSFFTAVHEVGHFLGLPHSSDRGSIMFPVVLLGQGRGLLRSDLSELALWSRVRLRPAVRGRDRIPLVSLTRFDQRYDAGALTLFRDPREARSVEFSKSYVTELSEVWE